ncbi:zinc knuckle CX2CX4HX4C containing protein [Tanacetum coccineum]
MENSDGMNKREAFNVSIQYEHGDDLAARMQRMKGNDGNAAAKPPRMQRMKGTIASNQMRKPIRGLRNPNTESIDNSEYDGVSASCGESVTQPMVNPSRNNDLMYGTQPTKVVRDPLNLNAEVEEPRVLESLTQIHKDQKHADDGQSDESFHAGFSKPISSVTPTSFGEFSMMNPSGEIDTDVEEVAWAANPNDGATRLFGTDYLNPSSSIGMNMNAFAEGDGVRVLTQAARFVKVSSSADSGSQQSYGANGPNLSSHDYMHPTGWTLGDQNDLTTETNSDTPIVQSIDINVKPNSYAGAAGGSNVNQPKDHANFCPMVAEKVFDGVNISIPHKVIEKVSVQFENTLYGYFIGKRMAFPVVEYYARNNWGKHGLKRIMMNAKGFFFFKFDTRVGLEAVLEEGPWMIRNSPIILKKWSMKTSLQKEELTRIPIWVKLHDVPIQVFEEDGISLIATYLGKPIMLDSYISAMCKDSWGRSSFARCLIEINSETDFKESITIGIPELDGPGFIKETIRVEYEWKPPRCHTCNIFGHTGDSCPKKVVVTPVANDTNDGFQKVVNKKRNNKGKLAGNIIPRGVPVSKGFHVGKEFVFKPRAPNDQASFKRQKDVVDSGKMKLANIATSNPFTTLGEEEDEEEDVENIYDESENLNIKNTRASTPAQMVVNENNLSVCAILESHVDVVIVYDTCKKVYSRWKLTSNGSLYNYYIDRRKLWNNLVGHVGLMRNRPWVLLGDFNAALNLEDHSAGGYELNAAMREFKEYVQAMEETDISQKDEKQSQKRQNRARNGKV